MKHPGPTFIDNPSIATRAQAYLTVTVITARVLESWKTSLFAHEWLHPDGSVKDASAQTQPLQDKRRAVETSLDAGGAQERPILGIGILDTIEIGSGRDLFLTLAARGLTEISVHIPRSHLDEFKPFIKNDPAQGSTVMPTDRASERGNIFFYVLLGAVLFAALGFAVSQSLRGNSRVENETIGIMADDVIATGSRLEEAVKRLRLQGTPATSVSFENPFVSGYANGTCSTGSCKIFDPDGGGLNWEQGLSQSQSTVTDWSFTGRARIAHVGSSDADLIALLPFITDPVCTRINLMANISGIPAIGSVATINRFQGSYNASPIQFNNTALQSKKAGCFYAPSITGTALSCPSGCNVYYHVLIER